MYVLGATDTFAGLLTTECLCRRCRHYFCAVVTVGEVAHWNNVVQFSLTVAVGCTASPATPPTSALHTCCVFRFQTGNRARISNFSNSYDHLLLPAKEPLQKL